MEDNNLKELVKDYMLGDEITTFIDSSITEELFAGKKIQKQGKVIFLRTPIGDFFDQGKTVDEINNSVFEDFNTFISKYEGKFSIYWFLDLESKKQSEDKDSLIRNLVLNFNRKLIENPSTKTTEKIGENLNLHLAVLCPKGYFSEKSNIKFFFEHTYIVYADVLKDLQYI